MNTLIEYSEQFISLIGTVLSTLTGTFGIFTTSIIAILTLLGLYFLLSKGFGWLKKGFKKLFKREVNHIPQTPL